jgi:hypothetical protein
MLIIDELGLLRQDHQREVRAQPRQPGRLPPPRPRQGHSRPRGEAMGLIEKELAANPRSVRALKARAQLRRMQGLDEQKPN